MLFNRIRIIRQEAKMLSAKSYGYVDLCLALVFVNSPWIFDFTRMNPGAETWVLLIAGMILIALSLMTRNDIDIAQAIKILSMRIRLALGVVMGMLLALSPFVFGFYHDVSFPHVMFGCLEIGISLTTRSRALYQPATRQ